MKQVIYYTNKNGKCPYLELYNSLNNTIRQRVDIRIDRLENGNFGDYKQISNNLYELRLKFGSGYRIYFTQQEDVIVLILCAGDKSTQSKDIKKAELIIEEIKE